MAQNLMMDPSLLTGGGLKSKTLGQPAAPVTAPAPVKTKAPAQKKAAADVTAAAPPAAPAPAAPAAPQTSSEVLRSLTTGGISGLPKELSLGYSQVADILGKKTEATTRTKQLEEQQAQDILAAKATALEESNKQARELYAQAQKDRWTEPAFSFEPHSLFNMAKMFSVLSTLGVMSGGKGKLSAQQTLAAMTGMLKGQRANDETEYKRQYQAYETNIAAIRAHNEDVRKDVEDMISLLATDREAASLKKELAIRKEGSGSILASYLDAGNYDAALKLLDSRNNLLEDVYKQEKESADKWAQLRFQAQSAENVARIRGETGRSSVLLAGRAENVREAVTQVAGDIKAATRLKGGVIGTFGDMAGQSGTSLYQSIANLGARKVTDRENRMYQQLIAGLESNLSMALGGGYASSGAKFRIDQYKTQIPREGDDGMIAATFLGRIRQEMDILGENFSSKPGATEQMSAAVENAVSDIDTAIPFTIYDVIDSQNLGLAPPTVSSTKTTGRKVTSQELKDYASSHNVSEAEAKSFLASQGYTF